jgi:hypothetical protein
MLLRCESLEPPMSQVGQSRRTTMFVMSGIAPIAAVMLQCHDRSKSAITGREQPQQTVVIRSPRRRGRAEGGRRHFEAKRLGGL